MYCQVKRNPTTPTIPTVRCNHRTGVLREGTFTSRA
jgi:hypothetical protein